MMRQFELVERVQAYNSGVDEELLNKAYVYAMTKHGSQVRASGDPYFSHPLEVAALLTDLRLDDATIAVALLHDTIEDTSATRQEIDEIFGSEIGALVDGLTKISRLDLASRKSKQAENFRKLLLAVSKDIRVLLVKLADRLHNMRTLHHVPNEKRRRVAEETLDIYAPLAGRMGIQEFCDEMQEIGFKTLFPEPYERIASQLEAMRPEQDNFVEDIEKRLTDLFAEAGLKATVTGRQKRPYAIFRKMEIKSLSFEQLSDIFGFRVIVETVPECYQALGIVHGKWPVIPGRFKDYVSTPKPNDYRSIHTAVRVKRHRVELQIRTPEMHRLAEYGIAAHALYKDGDKLVGGRNIGRLVEDSKAISWLRGTVDQLSDAGSSEEFLENTKLELFQDQVFCFTPKGKLITLPRGATLIDFAYAVHTDIGNRMINGKVNGHVSSILTRPNNGDEIEIMCAGSRTVVSGWEPLVRTGKAKAAIRKATRDARREQVMTLGQILVTGVLRRAGLKPTDERVAELAQKFEASSVDDFLVHAGEGQVRVAELQAALGLDPTPELVGKDKLNGSSEKIIAIQGLKDNVPIHFVQPGGAVPGDRIVGVADPGRGITIYPIQAQSLQDFEDQPERWVEVKWDVDPDAEARFAATLDVLLYNKAGVLADVAACIAEHSANIDGLSTSSKTDGFREVRLEIDVIDVKHLSRISRALRNLDAVCKVDRYFS